MFDTMTLTKAAGGLFGAFLIYLLSVWAAETIYGTSGEASHAATEEYGGGHKMGYVIEVASSEGGATEAAAPDFATLFAAADAGKGEKIFSKCKACHKIEAGVNSTGPSLYGVVDRPVDSAPGFDYSGALTQAGDVWTPENLFHFLEDPKGVAPGTKMGFAGLKKPEDRVNVIAYLASVPN